MEKQTIAEKFDRDPRLDPVWLWAERLLVGIPGIAFAGMLNLILFPLPLSSVWSMPGIFLPYLPIFFLPYFVTILLLRKNPPSRRSHSSALMLSAMGLVMTFPLVTIQALFWGIKALWSDSTNLLAIGAGVCQPLLILLAGRMYVLQGGQMRDVLVCVLAGLILGLVLFGPLLFLILVGAGM